MKKYLLNLFIVMMAIFVLTACGAKNDNLNNEEENGVVNQSATSENGSFKAELNYKVENFEMVNHRGETVTLESLKGKPWLAMFIFTNCTTVCPPMTFNMTEVQKEIVSLGIEDYNIVGFSVDPQNDSPEVLSNYLSNYSVPDETKWNLLTGYEQSFIEQFALNSFKSLVKKPAEDDQVIHGVSFYLVDQNGVVVKDYSGYVEDGQGVPYEEIAKDLRLLVENS